MFDYNQFKLNSISQVEAEELCGEAIRKYAVEGAEVVDVEMLGAAMIRDGVVFSNRFKGTMTKSLRNCLCGAAKQSSIRTVPVTQGGADRIKIGDYPTIENAVEFLPIGANKKKAGVAIIKQSSEWCVDLWMTWSMIRESQTVGRVKTLSNQLPTDRVVQFANKLGMALPGGDTRQLASGE